MGPREKTIRDLLERSRDAQFNSSDVGHLLDVIDELREHPLISITMTPGDTDEETRARLTILVQDALAYTRFRHSKEPGAP
jgi:hypothetical protein